MPEEVLARQAGPPTASQLEKINALAKRPLSKEEVFVFSAKLVGDMIIPNRYMKIDKSLLQVFKQDAQSGVAFMLDHPWAGFFARPKPALNYGRTFDASLKKSEGVEGETWALYADHYLVRGKEKDGISTDAIIADIEDGTLFDTSIGWGADTYECSICGNDIRNYSKCEHWPGQTYEVDGEQRLCYAIAKPPGFLMENSGVLDGAYPTAGVLSQGGDMEKNEGYVEVIDFKKAPPNTSLFHIYSANRGSLVTFMRRSSGLGKKTFALSTASEQLRKGGEKPMDEKKYSVAIGDVDVTNFLASVTTAGEKVDIKVDQLALEQVPEIKGQITLAIEKECANIEVVSFLTQEQVTAALGKEYSADEILKFAKEGIDYHAEVVGEAIAWGVRAQGNDFSAETWKATFSGMGTKQIKGIAKTFEALARTEIPAGRRTDPEAGEGAQAKPKIPDEAYKA